MQEKQENLIPLLAKSGEETEVGETTPQTLSIRQSLRTVAGKAAPLIGGRIIVASYYIANGLIAAQIGNNSATAFPLIMVYTTNVVSFGNGLLAPLGMLVGNQFGQQNWKEIGNLSRTNLLIATYYAPIALGLTVSSGTLLEAIGVAPAIAQEVTQYFAGFAPGILPFYYLLSDQHLLLGTQKLPALFISSSLFSLTAAAIGYPLALGWFGSPTFGMGGIGMGLSAAAWINWIGLRLYLKFNSDFKHFDLFRSHLEDTWQLSKKMLGMGAFVAGQFTIEWLSTSAILLYTATQLGNLSLLAATPSMQVITSFYFLSSGLSRVAYPLVAKYQGQITRALTRNNLAFVPVYLNNTKRLINTSLTLGIGAATLTTGLLAIPPIANFITKIFVNLNELNSGEQTELLVLSQALLLINGFGLIADATRVIGTGALQGLGEVKLPSFLSLISMGAFGVSCGILGDYIFDWGANWLFLSRDVGIIFSALALVWRWSQLVESNHIVEEDLESQPYCCFWKRGSENETIVDEERISTRLNLG